MAMYFLGMILFAFASTTWMMFLFTVPYCLGGICTPNLQSYLVSKVAANEQGELQGGLTSLQSLTTILGPLMMTGIFFFTTKEGTPFYFPGSAFMLAAVLIAGSFLIAYRLLRDKPGEIAGSQT
jgi:DHA1 family tetracycline resistance protein-like MFS transporter